MGRRIRAFFAFCYDFLIGDDWLVAAGVIGGLAATYLLSQASAGLVAAPCPAADPAAGQPVAGGPAAVTRRAPGRPWPQSWPPAGWLKARRRARKAG